MTGLDAILATIEEDAQSQAASLLEAAREEARQMLETAEKEAARQSQEILDEAQRRADAIRERAESEGLLEKRDQLLRCKQQLIREALNQVCANLENAPAEEYFSILLELAERAAQPGEGVLWLNARDLERLPKDFQQKLDKITPQGKILLSPTPKELESGFLLAYGPIEMDCTFPSLFQDVYDQLRDAAGAILFAPVQEEKEAL